MASYSRNGTGSFIDHLGTRIGENLERVFGEVAAAEVFHTLEQSDGRVIVGASVAERTGGFGFGPGEVLDSEPSEPVGGGGGGGAGQARTIAVIEITQQRVKGLAGDRLHEAGAGGNWCPGSHLEDAQIAAPRIGIRPVTGA